MKNDNRYNQYKYTPASDNTKLRGKMSPETLEFVSKMARAKVVLEKIGDERRRQDEKWGEQNHHPLYWMAILQEEVGEAAKALVEKKLDEYRTELIQCAAVAMAAIESLDRGEWRREL